MKKASLFAILTFILIQCSGITPHGIQSSQNATTPEGIPQDDQNLMYQISPFFDHGRLQLQFDLKIPMGPHSSIPLILPSSWAGQHQLYQAITGLTPLSPGTQLQATDQPHVKTLKAKPGTVAHVRYQLSQNWQGSMQQGRRFYRPILQKDYFHFIGETALVLPDWSLDKKRRVTLQFSKLPSHWQLAHSFSTKKNSAKT